MQIIPLKLLVLVLSISSLLAFSKNVICSSGWNMTAAGTEHTLGLLNNGSVYAWGENNKGQMGIGVTNSSNHPDYPVEVVLNATCKYIAARAKSSFAITSDGRLFAWGDNSKDQLGTGSWGTKYTPTQVGNDSDWSMIAAGDNNVLALKMNGSLYEWGLKYKSGGFIFESTTTISNPQQVMSGNYTWKNISAGNVYCLAIRDDGALFAWGTNLKGQLGDGTKVSKELPVRVGSNNTFAVVSAGERHVLAIDTSGNLFSWGDNSYGQLGDGTKASSSIPIHPTGGNNSRWKAVSAGDDFSMAIKEDGSLWSFGQNHYGRLGTGKSVEDVNITTRIGSNFNWRSISTGKYHCFGVTNDGFVIGWGEEKYLGDGSESSRYSPGLCPGLGRRGVVPLIVFLSGLGLFLIIVLAKCLYLKYKSSDETPLISQSAVEIAKP